MQSVCTPLPPPHAQTAIRPKSLPSFAANSYTRPFITFILCTPRRHHRTPSRRHAAMPTIFQRLISYYLRPLEQVRHIPPPPTPSPTPHTVALAPDPHPPPPPHPARSHHGPRCGRQDDGRSRDTCAHVNAHTSMLTRQCSHVNAHTSMRTRQFAHVKCTHVNAHTSMLTRQCAHVNALVPPLKSRDFV